MEARVKDDLHAPVDLGPRYGPTLDLGGNDGVHPRLEGLAGEVPPRHGQIPTNEPGDGGNGVGCGGLVQAGLLPQESLQYLGWGAGASCPSRRRRRRMRITMLMLRRPLAAATATATAVRMLVRMWMLLLLLLLGM